MDRSIFRFSLSTEDALSYVLAFTGLDLDGRILRVKVKDRASSTTRATLTIGAGLTVSGDDVSAAVAHADMASWPRGEYSADLVDITGEPSTIMAVRFVYDLPGNLVYGVKDRKAFVAWSEAKAYVTATGAVGPPGPPGSRGWAPDFAVTADGERQVLQVIDWIGGTGEKPDITGYLGAAGIVADIEDAIDVRGAAGADGTNGTDGSDGADGADGANGWVPLLAIASDGARRVHQVYDWVGGTGTKPATGEFVGASGLTSIIDDAVDIRGPAGLATIANGNKGDVTTSNSGDTWIVNDRAIIFAKMQEMATSRLLGRATAGAGDIEELSPSAARSILQITAQGDLLILASDAGTQRSALGASSAGSALFIAADQAAQRTALSVMTKVDGALLTLSGAAFDWTPLPAGVRKVRIAYRALSTNGSSIPIVQLGTASGFETSGYAGSGITLPATNLVAAMSNGFLLAGNWGATLELDGAIELEKIDSGSNAWRAAAVGGLRNDTYVMISGGSKLLGGALTQVRLTTAGGSNTFDNGLASISYWY